MWGSMLRGGLVILVSLLGGCGYRLGHLMPPGPQTIAVPIFENTTLYRGYEFTLTQAVINEILNKTHLRLAREAVADSLLKGVIVKVERPITTEDRFDRPTSFSVRITVEVEWVRLPGGGKLMPRTRITDAAEAILGRGENMGSALQEALADLARKIIHAMEDPALLQAKS